MKKIALKNAARGTAFDYAGQSWILLENDDGRALCLSKDIIETRAFDEGNCNNFAVATATSSPTQTTGGGCPPPSARSLTATSHSPAASTPMALWAGAAPTTAATACAPLVICPLIS